MPETAKYTPTTASGDLDAWLGRGPLSATPAEEHEDEEWYRMAVSDPRAWHRRGNPITIRVAQSLAGDAELPYQEPTIAKDCRRVAADLLAEAGDETLVLRAQERLRRGSGWQGLGLYIQKRSLVHEIHKIKAARRQFSELLDTDPIAEEDPLIPCPRCGKRIYPDKIEMDCKGH